MNSEKETSIKKLQKKLYSNQNYTETHDRKRLSHDEAKVATEWSDPVAKNSTVITPEKSTAEPKKKITGFTLLLIFSFIFFVASLLTALLIFSTGQNKVEYNRVELSILGPNSVAGGEPFTFDINIANDNQVDIIETDVIVTYPEGSYSPDLDEGTFEQETRQIEQIIAGTQESQKFSVILFGQEGDIKDIKVVYEYRVPGNNSVLFKERIYQVKLDSAPISVDVEHPSEALSGSDIEFSFSVLSNSNKTIEDVYVQIEYPFGFDVSEADPKPEVGTTDLYSIGDLASGESRTIRLVGKIGGQDGESRVFKYKVGLLDELSGQIEFVIASADSVVQIQSPPIKFLVTIDGRNASVHAKESDEVVTARVSLTNNLATPILDSKITGTLLGQGFDRRTVSTQGFYDTNLNQILWQKTNVPELATIQPGQTVSVGLNFDLYSESDLAGLVTDPNTLLKLTIQGQTFDFGNAEKQITAQAETTIKTETTLTLESALLHSTGPLQNSGPMQPTVGKESQYTVVWRIKNSTSLAENTVVTAVLPLAVEFSEAQIVEGSAVTYDQRTRTVTWKIPQIQPGAGYSRGAPQIAFKVAAIPSLSQTKDLLTLTTNKTITSVDSYTKQAIKETVINDTTALLKLDPGYVYGSEFVSEDKSLSTTSTTP